MVLLSDKHPIDLTIGQELPPTFHYAWVILVKHARDYWLLLAEGHLHRRLFSDMLRRRWALPLPAGERATG